ncbi:Metal resistance protein YCF1 [Smittium mucronatum]|uniref:Metal resistance protein YCF1 n=1 Tax=Smittium mucronatum TaxID=133383 RepID=A0A1R0H8C8_9FUNG|nr:Metal resistance protein YCF1 [Smittium mucronatum]
MEFSNSISGIGGTNFFSPLLCPDSGGWGPFGGWNNLDFTVCFQQGVLLPIVQLLFFMFGSASLSNVLKEKIKRSTFQNPNLRIKMLLIDILFITNAFLLYEWIISYSSSPPINSITIAKTFKLLSIIFSMFLTYFNDTRSNFSSRPLQLYWFSNTLLGIKYFHTEWILTTNPRSNALIYAILIEVITGSVLFFLENKNPTSGCDLVPTLPADFMYLETDDSTEDKADLFSLLTFSWMGSLIEKGSVHMLRISDLFNLPKAVQTNRASHEFWSEWSKERNSSRNSIFSALIRVFGGGYALAGFLKFLFDVLQFSQPVILKKLLAFVKDYTEGKNKSISYGFYYSAAMFLLSIAQTTILHQYFSLAMLTGVGIRSSLVSAIYKKTMLMSSKSRAQFNTGDIVNRMSVDAQRISDTTQYGHLLWSAPLQIFIALYLLFQTLGWSSLVGALVMVFAIPLNTYVTKQMRSIQKEKMRCKDSRVRLTEESLLGIKILKLYAWETPFLERIRIVRNDLEIKNLIRYGIMNSLQTAIILIVPFSVSFLSFVCYSYFESDKKGTLDSSLIFVSITLFNLLRFPLNMLPSVITSFVEASVGLQRIKDYLISEELNSNAVTKLDFHRGDLTSNQSFVSTKGKNPIDHYGRALTDQSLVSIENADFWWNYDSSSPKPTLSKITIDVKSNELLAIVGRVGSGKSSLLSAILGEMYKSKGSVTIRGKVAYAAQQPWIMNATVRDNILFGHKFDKEFYDKVIYACGLEPDLPMLLDGDMTEIGEKGINLSGGQKARLSLARAVYARADVYLLDDPLSAVDSHVGAHLFKNVLGPEGLLKSRARLLVTNSVPYLKSCDSIVLLQDGNIVEMGSYDHLLKEDGLLTSLVRDFGNDNSQSSQRSSDLSQESEEHIQCINNSKHTQPCYLEDDSCETDMDISNRDPAFVLSERKSSVITLPRVSIMPFSHTNQDDNQTGQLIESETYGSGQVSRSVYRDYLISCGVLPAFLFIISITLSQALNIYNTLWLKKWANSNDNGDNYPFYYLSIYLLIGTFFVLFGAARSYLLFAVCSSNSAKIYHERMLKSVFGSPMSFFDTTPIGRIINRFSRDQSVIDEELPSSFGAWLLVLLGMAFSVFAIVYELPSFLFVAVPISFFYLRLQYIYLRVSRDLKRLDSVSKSPIYQHFQETLGGVPTIRSYGQTERFEAENLYRLNNSQLASYAYLGINRWLAVRLELISAIMIFSVSFICVYYLYTVQGEGAISASTVGVTISFALSITQSLNWCIRMYVKVETDIVALERLGEYSNLPSEEKGNFTDSDIAEFDDSHKNWPDKGVVTFIDYFTRYRKDLEPVLKDINVEVKSNEKVGIVGRTGAGKSSFTLALFRIVEPISGSIMIDGIDITKISLFSLRSKLSIIPQDPVLFSGTIRFNLFPYSPDNQLTSVTDEELWNSLELSHLKDFVMSLDGGLDAEVQAGGENFSVGQRQLMCLARALVRKSQILVLDEATAAIDPQTDELIQKTIRSSFKDNTIITIAHRLNTVLDSDRILVLSHGEVVEYDSPKNLMANPKSSFTSFAHDAGIYEI